MSAHALQFAGPGPKDKFMLVSPDDSCELFYRAKKVEEDKASITIEYLDLPSSAVSGSTARGGHTTQVAGAHWQSCTSSQPAASPCSCQEAGLWCLYHCRCKAHSQLRLALQDKTEVLSKLSPRIWHGTMDKVGNCTAARQTGPAYAASRHACLVMCSALPKS